MIKTDFMKLYEELDNLNEANNKVTGRFDRPIARNGSWFGIDTKYSEAELAKMEQDKLAAEEAEKAREIKQHLEKAKKVDTADKAYQFNYRYRRNIFGENGYLPAIDPETLEPVYDAQRKKEIEDAWFGYRLAGIDKAAEERAAREQELKDSSYKWNSYATVNGKRKCLGFQYFPKDAAPEDCIPAMRKLGATALNKIMKDQRAFQEPFECDGLLTITCDTSGRNYKPEVMAEIQLTKKTK